MSSARASGALAVVGALSCCPLFGQQPIGPEFVVYGEAGSTQSQPRSAIASNGDFAVVWQDGVAEAKDAAWARWFDANGEALTVPLLLSGDPHGELYAFHPGADWEIAAPGPTFVWESTTGYAPDDTIQVRRYTRKGALIGEPHTVVHHELWSPLMASDAHGGLSVAWYEPAPGGDLEVCFAQVGPDGSPGSGQINVSEGSPDFDRVRGIATAPDGRTVVVWQREAADAGRPDEIWARLLGADGEPETPAFRVWDSPNLQRFGSVAMDGEGNFVVAWAEFLGDARNDDPLFRRFDRHAHPLGEPEAANVYQDAFQSVPEIAMDLAGNFAIAWIATDARTESVSELYGRAFRKDGTPVGGEIEINELTHNDQDSISLALSESGVLLASWRSEALDDFSDAHARRFVLPCAEDGASLCLGGGRFLVRAQWRTADGGFGYARPRALDGGSGAFWFFGSANLELVVKVLDGCGINGRHWVYVAGLTDVETHLTVTDTWTGEIWSTETELLTPFPPVQDVEALGGCAVSPPAATPEPPPVSGEAAPPEVGGGGCVADAEHLCLQQNRFRVGATYRSSLGHAGAALAQPLEPDSGAFRFFGPDNLELLVKVLDACEPFERYWVFAAGLTDLEVELTVEDTATGAIRTYRNALGVPFVPIQDASAFATCSGSQG